MPIVFPIDIYTHFNEGGAGGLKVMQRAFDNTDPRSAAETMGGESIVATTGTHLWYGTITVVPMHTALMRPLEAKVRALKRGDARFFIGDAMDDPMIGNFGNPVLGGVNGSDNHIIRIDGLPSGYVIPTGTRLSFDYDNGRRALHEVSSRSSANSSGQATVTVSPILQPGWAVGAAIKFNTEARCKAFMLPRSLKTGVADGSNNTQGFTFDWRQTLER